MSTADLPDATPSGPFPPDPTRSLLPPWLLQVLGVPLPPGWEDPAALSRGIAESLRAATECQVATLWQAGEFAELLPLLDTLLAAAPTEGGLLRNKGLCLLELGDWRGALATLTAAERLTPQDKSVRFFQLEVLLREGEYDQAERLTRQMLAAAPESSCLRYRFAACAALTGKPGQALAQLIRALVDDLVRLRQAAVLDPAFAGLRSGPAGA